MGIWDTFSTSKRDFVARDITMSGGYIPSTVNNDAISHPADNQVLDDELYPTSKSYSVPQSHDYNGGNFQKINKESVQGHEGMNPSSGSHVCPCCSGQRQPQYPDKSKDLIMMFFIFIIVVALISDYVVMVRMPRYLQGQSSSPPLQPQL